MPVMDTIIMTTTIAMLTPKDTPTHTLTWRITTMSIITMITGTITATSMTSIAATPMVRRRVSSPVPAAGSAVLARFSRSASGPGIAATFVMGLGTAITVATIAVVAVTAKDLARRLSGTKEGGGALFMRGVEFGAAGLVLLFGVGLLFGYLAAERVTCI